jgi:hypothetical protein
MWHRSLVLLTPAACWSPDAAKPLSDDIHDTDTLAVIPDNDDDNMPPNLAAARVLPTPIDFGSVDVGVEKTIRVELRNEMDSDWPLSDVSLIPAGEQVNLPLDFHTEIALGVTLAPGENFFFDIHFQAEAAGDYNGNLDFILPQGARKSVRVVGTGLPVDTGGSDSGD